MKVGILYSPLINLTEYINVSSREDIYPTLVLPESKTNCDILVIPHGLGVPGSFQHQAGLSSRPVCPYFERFLSSDRGLKYYLKRELKIVLVGSSRAVLYELKGVKYKIGEDEGDIWVTQSCSVQHDFIELCPRIETSTKLIKIIQEEKSLIDDFEKHSRIHSGQANVDSEGEADRKTT